MSKVSSFFGVAGAAVIASGAVAGTTTFNPTNNAIATRGDIIVPNFLQPLDLTSYFGLAVNVNQFTQSYVGPGGAYSGTLTLDVYADAPAPGPAVTDVLLVYTFTGNAGLVGTEGVDFGVNSGNDVDVAALTAATHGRVTGESTAGQTTPDITIFDNTLASDNFFFDFGAVSNDLGGPAVETFTWYIRTNGSVKLDFTDVTITDIGSVQVQFPMLVVTGTQPDLDFPAPGAVALLGPVGLMAARRRRA